MRPSIFHIQQKVQTPDTIGGFTESWSEFKDVEAYLDMSTGSDRNTVQNAIIEQSTHILIVPTYTSGITDKMRVVDDENRWYSITYVDDPMGQHHHLELYLTFEGVVNG